MLYNMIRIDKYTGEEFHTNKRNKFFSCKENQVLYNNMISSDLREEHSFIDIVLKKNERILRELLDDNVEVNVSSNELKLKGFTFNVFTHYKKKDSVFVFGIYEYTYRSIITNSFIIRKDGRDI